MVSRLRDSRGRCFAHLTVYFIFAVLVVVITPFVGSERIDIGQVASYLFASGQKSIDADIFLNLRLPRVLLGFLAGGTLAVVGCVFQVILRNPLATPYTLGVTGGSAVGAYIAIAFPFLSINFGLISSVQLFSLVGAGAVLLLIYFIARKPGGISMATLLLAGVTIGILCGAFLLLIRYLTKPNLLVSMDRWMMGALDTVGYRDLAMLLPILLPGIGLCFAQMKSLNHISFGSEMAMGYGVDVKRVLGFSFLGGSLATAGVVSLTGPVAFVGLLVPHCIRRISGYDHRIILPGAFLAGGGFLVLCDTISRTVIAPSEMPVGIITALIGGPFFIYLLFKAK